MRVIGFVLAFCVLLTSGVSAQVVYPPYTPANPVPGTAGGLGPYAMPTPTAGSTDVFDGDSITVGYGSSVCQGTYQTLVSNPAGTCMTDLVTVHDSAKEMNLGISGTCLLYDTAGDGSCNSNSSTSGELIDRYQNDATYITNGSRVYLQIGTNDYNDMSNNSTSSITFAAFRAALVTVTSYFSAKAGGPTHIVLGEIPFLPGGFQFYGLELNAQIADVAKQYGYALADNSQSYQTCAVTNTPGNNFGCNFDNIHPNDTGYAQMALGWEAASYSNAVGAVEADRHMLVTEFMFDSSTNVASGGKQVLFNATTGAQRNSCGGYDACSGVTSATDTTGYGSYAAGSSASNCCNTAFGSAALYLDTGTANIAVGRLAGANATTGNYNIFIGYQSEPSGITDSNEIVIGGNTVTGRGSNSITIASAATPGFYAGTGAPTFSAPNGSMYLRYDGGTGSRWYANTSGASTSGTTWTALAAP